MNQSDESAQESALQQLATWNAKLGATVTAVTVAIRENNTQEAQRLVTGLQTDVMNDFRKLAPRAKSVAEMCAELGIIELTICSQKDNVRGAIFNRIAKIPTETTQGTILQPLAEVRALLATLRNNLTQDVEPMTIDDIDIT